MLDEPCSAKWEHLPPLLPQSSSGAMSPLPSLLQSWNYLCVSSPGRAGAPGNQKPAAAAGSAKPGAPHARCGLEPPVPETPALCNTLCKSASTGAQHKPCQAPQGWSQGPGEIPQQSLSTEQSPRQPMICAPGRMPFQAAQEALSI